MYGGCRHILLALLALGTLLGCKVGPDKAPEKKASDKKKGDDF